jgi:SanA protein
MKKKWTWFIPAIVIILLTLIYTVNYIIDKQTDKFVYNEFSKIQYNKVGLLLGTSKFLNSGKPNQYFHNRIKVATDLYNSQKIERFVISGDNSIKEYNEPLDMKNELIINGIPDSCIYLDYAGFDTYDSVIRLNKIFGQKSFTIISQEFHNRRAVYIARYKGLAAVGFNAKDVDVFNGFKTKLREKLARVKVFFDLIFDVEPKFLGDKIEIK